MPGIYDWTWLDWLEDSGGKIVAIADSRANQADVTAGEESGEAHIVAQAQITADVAGDSIDPITGAGEIISGELKVRAFICANPWPAYDDGFPFIENEIYSYLI